MPPFRDLAVVVSPPATAALMMAHAELLARVLRPRRIRLMVEADAHESAATARLDQLPPVLTAALTAGELTRVELRGSVLDAVLHETVAMAADLLLVGCAPAGTDRRVLVRRLAMQAPCSVWMIPAGAPPTLTKVLVPTDLSARSADALHVATALAAATGASCTTLHVGFDPTVVGGDAEATATIRERDAFTLFMARVDLHGVDLEEVFEEGSDVSRVILRVAAARQADLVVMGTRGRTRAASLLIGSETEHTLQESDRPVLAVKHFGARLRFLEALLDPRFTRREGPRFG